MSNNKTINKKEIKVLTLKKILFNLKTYFWKLIKLIKNIFRCVLIFIKKNSKKTYLGLLKLFKIIKFKITKIFKKEKKDLLSKTTEFKLKKKIDKTKKDLKNEIVNINYPIIKSLTGRILPLSLTKWDKKRRKNIYLKEAILFSISLTLIDVYCFYNLSFMNILNVFDNSVWNLITTVALTLVVLLMLSYIIDYLITESIVRKYQRKLKK